MESKIVYNSVIINWRCFYHSVFADGKQQMDFVWNRFALIHPRSEEKFLWPSSKPIPSKTEHCGFGLLGHPKTKTARADLFSKGLYSLEFQVHCHMLYS